MFDSPATALGHIAAERSKPLLVVRPERLADLPDVPTAAEAGFPGLEGSSWMGLFGPPDLPRPIVNRIKKLTRMYGYYLDKALWDELLPLFTDDCTVEVSALGVYEGKHRLEVLFKEILGNGPAKSDANGLLYGQLYNHLILQGIVHVDRTFHTPYDQSWATAESPKGGMRTQHPPDRPPTQDYDPAQPQTPRHPHPLSSARNDSGHCRNRQRAQCRDRPAPLGARRQQGLVGRRRHPGLCQSQGATQRTAIQIQEGRLKAMLEQLLAGELDAVLTLYTLDDLSGFDTAPLTIDILRSDPLVVLAPPALWPTREHDTTWGELSVLPWILPPYTTQLRRIVDGMFLHVSRHPPPSRPSRVPTST